MKFKKKTNQDQQVRSARNQGSGSAPVFSYYSNRSNDTANSSSTRPRATEAIQLKDRSLLVKYLPSFVSLALVLAAVIYLTTLSVRPRVVLAGDPNKPVIVQATEVYEQAASSVLESSLANRSKLTIDTDEVANRLGKQFPELGDMVVTIPVFGRRPVIEARPAVPRLILTGNGGSFVIDSNGVPVLRASQLASSVRDPLPVIADNSDTTIELGKQILTHELVSFISDQHAYFKAKNIQPESYVFPALSNEIHVKLLGKGYFIKFNTEADVRQQVGTYFAVQERLDSDNTIPSEYIDVRVEERVYIK